MLENMFIGKPPGNYDRLLDFSRAVTGNLFFVPTATFLEGLSEAESGNALPASSAADSAPTAPGANDGSLHIGSLKGDIENE
jgi:putative iron-dependent peroxidase